MVVDLSEVVAIFRWEDEDVVCLECALMDEEGQQRPLSELDFGDNPNNLIVADFIREQEKEGQLLFCDECEKHIKAKAMP
jgi:hypothetical protein